MTTNRPMAGQVCVVTGATSGIGFVTARELAKAGASVVAVGRDSHRLSDTVSKISSEAPDGSVRGYLADLFLQSEVRRLSSQIVADHPQVHVLVNNAGAIFSRRALTSEGFERTWALNVVAPFLLTQLLLGSLKHAAPARVVNVASAAHRGARLDFENLQGEESYGGYRAYGRSKLALVLSTYELSRRLLDTQVTANALHPGFVATRFGKNNPGAFGAATGFFTALFGISSERGAQTSIFLASDPSVAGVTGKYFVRGRETASSPRSYDMESGARVWDVLALQTGSSTDSVTTSG
jgi:NAD(P)-dependent dehydrogenase (short-subunit alcohol dehydrogenase family)